MNDPGIQVVVSGGSSFSATVSGGEQDVYGTTTATLVEVGGTQIVESGGTASGTIVDSGGTERFYTGGVASGTMIDSGGFVQVNGADTQRNNQRIPDGVVRRCGHQRDGLG